MKQELALVNREEVKVKKKRYYVTPWGLKLTPFMILPTFDCPNCNGYNCKHFKERSPPKWIGLFHLWKRGRTVILSATMRRKFNWLKTHADLPFDNPGFEDGDFTGWTTFVDSGQTLEVVGSPVNEGSNAAHFISTNTGSNETNCYETISNETEVFHRFYTRFANLLDVNLDQKWIGGVIRGSEERAGFRVKFTSATGDMFAQLLYREDAGRLILDDTGTVFAIDTWYCIECHYLRASAPGANDGVAEVFIDGVIGPQDTAVDSDTLSITSGRLLNGQRQNEGTNDTLEWFTDSNIGDNASQINCIVETETGGPPAQCM